MVNSMLDVVACIHSHCVGTSALCLLLLHIAAIEDTKPTLACAMDKISQSLYQVLSWCSVDTLQGPREE